jgi:hypothetical protein
MAENVLAGLMNSFDVANQILQTYGIQITPVKIILNPEEDPNAIYIIYAIKTNDKFILEELRRVIKNKLKNEGWH